MQHLTLAIWVMSGITFINTILLIYSTQKKNSVQAKDGMPARGSEKDCFEADIGDQDAMNSSSINMSLLTEQRLLREFEKVVNDKFFLRKKITLAELADLLGTNTRYTTYIVSKCTNLSFNRCVQQARIEYFIDLLEKNPDRLNEKFAILADEIGFSSVNKFSSVFKQVKGISPSEYFNKQRAIYK